MFSHERIYYWLHWELRLQKDPGGCQAWTIVLLLHRKGFAALLISELPFSALCSYIFHKTREMPLQIEILNSITQSFKHFENKLILCFRYRGSLTFHYEKANTGCTCLNFKLSILDVELYEIGFFPLKCQISSNFMWLI